MSVPSQSTASRFICTAFADSRRIASGPLHEVALKVKEAIDRDRSQTILIFEDASAQLIEVDLRGSVDDVRERLAAWAPGPSSPDAPAPESDVPVNKRGPGRPKLGVVAREVTLLPRHWAWLGEQPGGASVALRKLVEDARRQSDRKDRVRRSQDATYRFMAAMAGDYAGFEEASRALFAGDRYRFGETTQSWPTDVRDYALMLAEAAFSPHHDKSASSEQST